MANGLLHSFLERATASGAKSTVLTDLRWFIGLGIFALLGALRLNAPPWILIGISTGDGFGCLLYLAAYIYFAIRSPDSLRSEKFTLSKMAIERSITGDNLSGWIDPENPGTRHTLPPSETEGKDL